MKTKATYTPIETPCGILRGRTAMFLGEVHLVDRILTLEVDIEVNRPDRDAIPYDVVFHDVHGMRITARSDWEDSSEPHPSKSSFDEVTGSAMLASASPQSPSYRHFWIATYDDVFDVIATRVEFFDVTPTPEERMKAAQERER